VTIEYETDMEETFLNRTFEMQPLTLESFAMAVFIEERDLPWPTNYLSFETYLDSWGYVRFIPGMYHGRRFWPGLYLSDMDGNLLYSFGGRDSLITLPISEMVGITVQDLNGDGLLDVTVIIRAMSEELSYKLGGEFDDLYASRFYLNFHQLENGWFYYVYDGFYSTTIGTNDVDLDYSINNATVNSDPYYNQFPTTITIHTQEDADNINTDDFANNPDLTSEENEQIKRAVLDIALHLNGFDIGYDVWALTDEEASRNLAYEHNVALYDRHGIVSTREDFLHILRDERLDMEFWIVTDFMMFATIENNSIFMPVRIRSWPREHPYLDSGSWILLRFINIDGNYRLIYLSFDA